MKTIKISKEISLPVDMVTQAIAILAKRRVGKSYTMRRIVEQLLESKQQVVVVDPKGDQWGIRSSADGKKPGFPMVIIGGEHGDLPLEVNAGEMVAKLVVEDRVNLLLDLSMFRKHEIATFMAIFLENLYRLKAQERFRTPVMVVIDEADAIAPQKPQKGEERMLGAADDLVRRGGQRGLGCILVTQRSAVLNKNVLTQVEMLVVLRTISPQDLAAMKAWIDVHGTIEEGKIMMESLPSLPIGTAWFWSPGWPTKDGLFTRTHILPITTFDSAATPAPGQKKVVPKNLADVDLGALKNQMAATIEKAKAEDPKLLKKRIAELEAAARHTPTTSPKVASTDPKAIDQAVQVAVQKTDKAWEVIVNNWRKYAQDMRGLSIDAYNKISKFKEPALFPATPTISNIYKNDFKHIPRNTKRFIPGIMIPPMEIPDEEKSLSKGAKAVLAYLESVYPASKTKAQLWIATGYSPGGGFNNCLYELGTLIDKTPNGYKANKLELGFEASLDLWRNKLGGGARKVFDFMLENPDTPYTKEELAQATGYAMGGGFNNNIYELTGPELIKKTLGGYVVNPEALDL